MDKEYKIEAKEKVNNLKEIFIKNIRWIFLIVFLIIFLFIFEDVLDKEIDVFDNFCYQLLSNIIKEPITTITKFITTLGSAYVIIPIGIICIFYFWKRKESVYIPVNLIIVFFMNQLLKRIVQRPRPEGFRIVEESGYSFPSGHTMVAAIFYGFIIYLVSKSKYKKKTKIVINTILTILILLIGISRIYLGVHYATDVIASYLVSISYLIIFTHFIEKYQKK